MIKFYTAKEIAEILQLKERTIQNWIKDGKIKGVKFGKCWRVSEEDFKEFCKNGIDEE
ncbi:helix-turn-helix domain-containing protein [uncultured Parvimonas sp.]|uniref:helix-turn-helix domain-containing protein n=1 Tax=uncultured Parvimonas sp. TaxID=747372 RepID=UPI0025954CE1|nr:helix-turn-helix domain-containing protein [uncultured Parvimonas sp.]